MKIILNACVFLVLIIGFPSFASKDKESVHPTSLITLMVNGEKLEGKKTRVFGYFDFVGHTNLFLTKDHAQAGDFTSAIRVLDDTNGGRISTSTCIEKYVYVTGRLEFDQYGMPVIVQVSEIYIPQEENFCWKR